MFSSHNADDIKKYLQKAGGRQTYAMDVHTPDPSKHHPLDSVPGFAGKVSQSAYTDLIPRATRDGASRGRNHNIAAKQIIVDPNSDGPGGRLVIDTDKYRQMSGEVAGMLKAALETTDDYNLATLSVLSNFAVDSEETESPKESSAVVTPPVESPATQSAVPAMGRPYSFGGQPQPTSPTDRAVRPPDCEPRPTALASGTGVSLMSELMSPAERRPTPVDRPRPMATGPTRKVVIELPTPGRPISMTCFYHDVLRQGDNLVLVYDHDHPGQAVWFPPAMGEGEEVIPVAMEVTDATGTGSTVYSAYPLDISFKYHRNEFYVLKIELEKRR
jgi:hypothetical protein